MSLCRSCAGIQFDDLYSGLATPWNRTVSDLRSSAGICELCALLVQASDAKLLDDNPNSALYLPGNCNIETDDGDRAVPRQVVHFTLYSGIEDTGGLASGRNASDTEWLLQSEKATYVDRRLKAALATLRVICGMPWCCSVAICEIS